MDANKLLRQYEAGKRSFSKSSLSEADLSGADLKGADLSGATLVRANLSGADLKGADLSRANLRRANLRRAEVQGVNFEGAIFGGADLKGLLYNDQTRFPQDFNFADTRDGINDPISSLQKPPQESTPPLALADEVSAPDPNLEETIQNNSRNRYPADAEEVKSSQITIPPTGRRNQKVAIFLVSLAGASIVIGAFIAASSLFISPIINSLNLNLPSSITQQEAVDLIERWLQAKPQIFAPPYDRQLAASLTTDSAYEDITKSGGRIDWLQQRNAYYRYGAHSVEPTGNFSSDNNKAEIEVRVTEERFYYIKGRLAEATTDSDIYRFTLKLVDGTWKIAERQ